MYALYPILTTSPAFPTLFARLSVCLYDYIYIYVCVCNANVSYVSTNHGLFVQMIRTRL